MELLVRILDEEPIPLREGPPHPALTGPLGAVLRLARRPECRYQDVRAMRSDLLGCGA